MAQDANSASDSGNNTWAGITSFLKALSSMPQTQASGSSGYGGGNSFLHALFNHIRQQQMRQQSLQTPGGMGYGPINVPSQPVQGSIPAILQAGVSGPLSLQGAAAPPTPQAQPQYSQPMALTQSANHFETGFPNLFGSRS